MLPSRNIVVVVAALVVSARATPPSDVYDPDSIPQNEKLLRLLLRLASHTASRLIHLKKELRSKPQNSSPLVEPSVRMRFPDGQLTASVLDEVLEPSHGNEKFQEPIHPEDFLESIEPRANFRSKVEKSSKVVTKDSQVAPVEIANRILLDVDDGNKNNNLTDKENLKNASLSSGSSGVKSETQKATIRKTELGTANRTQNTTSGSGIADQVANVTPGSRSGGKSPAREDAHIAKATIRETGGKGIANRTQKATSGSGIADQGANGTSGLRSGGKSPARDVKSLISDAGASRIVDQALNVTSGLQSSVPGLTNATRVLGVKNVARGIESMISNARKTITGSIAQPKNLMGSLPLFRSLPDTQSEPPTPKKSSSDSTKVASSVTNVKASKTSNDDEVSELELKGFALQFADALRPVKSTR